MAFAARLGELTDELIAVIASTSHETDPDRFNVLRETSLRELRHHSFLRTNQFNVEAELDGLEERFRVVNRDQVADTLRDRLDILPRDKWTPEALHLLLQLSDKPIQKSNLRDLDLLKEPDQPPEIPLKWAEIANEDDWAVDRELWRNVDFTNDSSEDELEDESVQSEKSDDTTLSSIEAQYRRQATDYLEVDHDELKLQEIEESQAWRTPSTTAPEVEDRLVVISDLQAVREVLFMLHGLKNSLFQPDGAPLQRYKLCSVGFESSQAILGAFGQAGGKIRVLRNFGMKSQQIPLMQVFRDAVYQRLAAFDRTLASIQARFIDIKSDVVVSLMQVLDEIKPNLHPLLALADIVEQLQFDKYPHPFRYLEMLFDAAGSAQLQGDEPLYRFLGVLFFECFRIYVRPIRLWMESGELAPNDKVFFISDSVINVPLAQLWQSRYKLLRTADGSLHAPRFLHPTANKIFNTGKSVVVLKQLGKYDVAQEQLPEPPLEFDAATESETFLFVPFREVFNTTFARWMESKHHTASVTLRQTLFDSCNLQAILHTLQHVYLMSNAYRSDLFAFSVFTNLDIFNPRWHDRFTLSEKAHEAFAGLYDAHRISITIPKPESLGDVNEIRRSVRLGLPNIQVSFAMAWPVRIVVSEETMSRFHAVFTFLLQLRRATSTVQRFRLMSDGIGDTGDDKAAYYGLRTRLIVFYQALQSYLTMLVIEPLMTKLRHDLDEALDIDAMINIQSVFSKQLLDEACLGSKLEPIRECIYDVLDLAIRLDDARKTEAERDAEETQELSRLSLASPTKDGGQTRYLETIEEEDETFMSEYAEVAPQPDAEKTYTQVLREIRWDFDRHLRFICGGLRGVSRASSHAASGKWDTLAEMLEIGF